MPERLPILDANVFIRHLRQDHPDLSSRASAYLGQIESGGLAAQTNVLVISEVVYVLQSFYKMPKPDIAEIMLRIIALSNLKIPDKAQLRRTFDWFVRYNLSFVDAYLAAVTRLQQLPELVSFDRNYDRVPRIRRVEP